MRSALLLAGALVIFLAACNTIAPASPIPVVAPLATASLPALPPEDSKADDVVLQWESHVPFSEGDNERCQRLAVTRNHQAQYGKCSEKPRTAQVSGLDFDEMLAQFASFEYRSGDTTLSFRGRGKVTGEVWQRAIATWAWSTFGEMNSGRVCAACRTSLAWALGSIPPRAGSCGMLVVLNFGYAYKEEVPCGRHEAKVTAQGWLTTEEWTQLDSWIQNRSSVYVNGNASYMDGKGSQAMSPQEIKALEDWARKMYERLE